MAMHPNIPASRPPSAPTTERDSQPMCPMAADERLRNMENQFYLLTATVRAQGETIERNNKEMAAMRQRLDDQEEELATLRAQRGADSRKSGILIFDFVHHKKKEVYAWIIEGLRLGLIKSCKSALIRFLAQFTNLGREDSIRSQLYDYI